MIFFSWHRNMLFVLELRVKIKMIVSPQDIFNSLENQSFKSPKTSRFDKINWGTFSFIPLFHF